MKKYTITIEETISQDFDVMANNAEQARAIAIEMYNLGELVLAPGNLIHKQMRVQSDANNSDEWIEF
jgi:hypothetical protein